MGIQIKNLRFRFVFAAFLVLAAPVSSGVAQAASPKTNSVVFTEKTPFERPEFPLPNDPGQLFFLQRSMNANTVVYAARLLPDGQLDPRAPVQVYWRRFNDSGERKELGFFENNLAFGVKTRPGKTKGEYLVEFRALPGRAMTLRIGDDGKPEMWGFIDTRKVRPFYIFVDLDDSALVPTVQYLYLHGIDVDTGKAVTETIEVSGGDPAR